MQVELDRRQVALWRRRFIEGGIKALLQDASRPGRRPSVTPEVEARIVNATLREKPLEPRTGARARWPRSWG